MTEQELIEEDFEKILISKEESGNKLDYHYYRYQLNSGYYLYSSDSEESTRNKWVVYFDEMKEPITDIEDVQTLIGLFNKWSKVK